MGAAVSQRTPHPQVLPVTSESHGRQPCTTGLRARLPEKVVGPSPSPRGTKGPTTGPTVTVTGCGLTVSVDPLCLCSLGH